MRGIPRPGSWQTAMIGFRQRSRAVFRWLLRLLVGRKFSSSLEQNRAAADRLDEVMRELLRQ